MTHIHDDDRLTFACPACIEHVQRDQWVAYLPELSKKTLIEEWMEVDHLPNDWRHAPIRAELVRRGYPEAD